MTVLLFWSALFCMLGWTVAVNEPIVDEYAPKGQAIVAAYTSCPKQPTTMSLQALKALDWVIADPIDYVDEDNEFLGGENHKWQEIIAKWQDLEHDYYEAYYDFAGGVIIFKELHRDRDAVEMEHFSNVTAVIWKHYCGQENADPKGLKRMLQWHTTNPLTVQIVEAVAKEEGAWRASDTGERDFTPFTIKAPAGTRAFNALLASPNGRGQGFMLLGHQDVVGEKTITVITVQRLGYKLYDMSFDIASKGSPVPSTVDVSVAPKPTSLAKRARHGRRRARYKY